jgi:uncharacterized protein YycO
MTPRAGDIFLEHDGTLTDRLIQFGQSLRRGKGASHWNHAGIFVSEFRVVEATGSGVVMDRFDAKGRGETVVIPVEPATARRKVAEFALARVGRQYGWGEIASIVVSLLTGTKWWIAKQGTFICSGLTASALDYAGIDVGDAPLMAMPADLDVPSFTAAP